MFIEQLLSTRYCIGDLVIFKKLERTPGLMEPHSLNYVRNGSTEGSGHAQSRVSRKVSIKKNSEGKGRRSWPRDRGRLQHLKRGKRTCRRSTSEESLTP